MAAFCMYHDPGLGNPKSEGRNPKQIQIPNRPMFKTSRRSVVLVIPLLVLGICFGLRISIFGFESPALGGAVQIRPGGAPGQRAKPCLFSRGVGKGTPETRRAQRNWEGEAATANHLSVIDSQVTEIGLSLRPSRLCGLTGLSSTA